MLTISHVDDIVTLHPPYEGGKQITYVEDLPFSLSYNDEKEKFELYDLPLVQEGKDLFSITGGGIHVYFTLADNTLTVDEVVFDEEGESEDEGEEGGEEEDEEEWDEEEEDLDEEFEEEDEELEEEKTIPRYKWRPKQSQPSST